MSSMMIQAEYAGIGFWIVSLLFVTRPARGLVATWHLVALALSFAAPALIVLDPARGPARAVLTLMMLGVVNGVLASAWCGRIQPAVSKRPVLAITLAGFVSTLFLAYIEAPPTRQF